MIRYLKMISLTASAAAMIVLAPPAAARGTAAGAADTAGAAGASSASEEKVKLRPSKVRYCLAVEPSTGTRITQRQCRTKADWLADGIDVTSLK